MKEYPDRREDAETTPEEFSLESIMREFGGWSKREEPVEADGEPEKPEPAQEPEPPKEPEAAEAPESPEKAKTPETAEGTKQETPAPEEAPAEEKCGKKADKAPETAARIWTWKPETAEAAAGSAPEMAASQEKPEEAKAHGKRKKPAPKVQQEKPQTPPKTVEEAYRQSCQVPVFERLRLGLTGGAALLGVLFMILGQSGWQPGGINLRQGAASAVQLALMALCLLLSPETAIRGGKALVHLRADLNTMVLCTAAVTGIHCGMNLSSGQLPFCTVASIGLFFCQWDHRLRRQGNRLTLKTVLAAEGPVLVTGEKTPAAEGPVLFRREGGALAASPAPEAKSLPERVMELYAPMAMAFSLAMALLVTGKKGGSFLWALSAMLSAGLPVAAGIAGSRPFAFLARQLHRSGAALWGWAGAKSLKKARWVVLTDRDLFPESRVAMSGMKVYGGHNVSKVVGYTWAIIEKNGGSLTPLFAQLMKSQNGRHCTLEQFKRYESGGLGAEIQGDVVLAGSLGFMQLMGVHMPEGTRVKQAVYLSINGELAGVFAIQYGPSAVIRGGLAGLCRQKRLSPILAVRDFMLTPGMIHKKYRVPTESLEYPAVGARAELSESRPADGAETVCGVLSRDTLPALAQTVLGGRALWLAAVLGIAFSAAGGVLGLGLMALLTYLGAEAAACGFNAMIYCLVWVLPVWLVGRWSRTGL